MEARPSLSTQLRQGDVLASACPSRGVLRHITGQWAVLILIVLQDGTLRFSELRRRIDGVSERMLAQTLKHLEQDGIITRTVHAVVPPHVEYALTPLGQEAAAHVGRLADWVEVNLPQLGTAPAN
ncbi:winged helix-turn-helix transcriptional regulator [Sphingomonas sp. 37zxx]|uniref:winged helix-turn-helix transcriptional regulator n=1 Tax=Sphingomonas sp. 37zxx TaxID=1550073 RepID=UPI0009DF94FE|nr:helix-turn-helix domain-containing protein [Sphingomonas sp. 37zxx]